MPSDIDTATGRARLALVLLLAAAGFAAGCQTVPAQAPASPEPPLASTAAPAAIPVYIPVPAPPAADPVTPVLAYADRVRGLGTTELAQEIARWGDNLQPADQLRLALALAQTRQLYDLVRAQDLLQKLLASNDAESQRLHPLARLLAARFAEQRRVEDQLDRQGQQLRDAQRRLEQSTDKLEALREIERSLTGRPAGTTAPPSSRGRGARAGTP
jgi:hypothetical protein